MKLGIIFFFILILYSSCNFRKERPEGTIIRDYKNILIKFEEGSVIPLQIIDSVWYIKLENTAESLVGDISKLFIHFERIFILDKITNSVFIFDLDGHYINKISRAGRGPGEHSRILDFQVDTVNNQLIISDSNQNLFFYDTACAFIRQIQPSFAFRSFSIHKHNYLFSLGNIPNEKAFRYNLLTCDTNLHVINRYFPYNNITDGHHFNFFINRDILNIVQDIKSSIYRFENDTLIEAYRVDFESFSKPEDFYLNKTISVARENPDFPFFLDSIIENDEFLYFRFIYKGLFHSCIFSKATSNIVFGSRYSKANPYLANCNQKSLYKEFMISYLQADNFLKLYARLPEIKNHDSDLWNYRESLSNLVKKCNPHDNPILIFTRYIKF